MNDRKVCFICCTNDRMYEKECRLYLERLSIPEEVETEIKMVYDAASLTSGYNQAMRESDAKYKVYLHQDVFVLNQNFIADMLSVFADEQVGMMGVVGCLELPKSGIVYVSWDKGRLKTNNTSFKAFEMAFKDDDEDEEVSIVSAVDGLLIATQYDLPWREDLFDGWDFYDISQSLEFTKAGYLIKVPRQQTAWCFHDDGFLNLRLYDHYRKIFVQEYGAYLTDENCMRSVPFDEGLQNAVQKLKEKLIQQFNEGQYNDIYTYLCENYEIIRCGCDNDLTVMGIFMKIAIMEQNQNERCSFFGENITWEEAKMKYQEHKFWLYEMEQGVGEGEQQLVSEMTQDLISPTAIFVLIVHNAIEKEKMLSRFADIYQKLGNFKMAESFILEAFRLIEEAKKESSY